MGAEDVSKEMYKTKKDRVTQMIKRRRKWSDKKKSVECLAGSQLCLWSRRRVGVGGRGRLLFWPRARPHTVSRCPGKVAVGGGGGLESGSPSRSTSTGPLRGGQRASPPEYSHSTHARPCSPGTSVVSPEQKQPGGEVKTAARAVESNTSPRTWRHFHVERFIKNIENAPKRDFTTAFK